MGQCREPRVTPGKSLERGCGTPGSAPNSSTRVKQGYHFLLLCRRVGQGADPHWRFGRKCGLTLQGFPRIADLWLREASEKIGF